MSEHKKVPCFCTRTFPPDVFRLNQQQSPRVTVDSLMSRFKFEVSTLTPNEYVEEEEEEEEIENDISESILDDEIIEEKEEEEPEEFANGVSESILDDELIEEEEKEEAEEFANDVSESILDEEIIEEEEEEEDEFGNDISESILDDSLDVDIIVEEEEEEEEDVNDVSESIRDDSLDEMDEEEEIEVDISENMETTMEFGNHSDSEYVETTMEFNMLPTNDESYHQGQPHVPHQTNDQVQPTRLSRVPRMRVFSNFIHYRVQVTLSTLDSTYSNEIEEEEDNIVEVVDQDISHYMETRTYYAPPVMDIDGNEGGDPVVDDEEREVCSICLLEYQDEDTIGTLQCCHEFHAECIKKWMQRKKACPFCRASVVPTKMT